MWILSLIACQDLEKEEQVVTKKLPAVETSKTVATKTVKQATNSKPISPPKPMQEPLVGGPYPSLLLSQAWFWTDEKNNSHPGPARLEIWRQTPSGWSKTRLEDESSNVFHKAIPYQDGILTIGAEKAMLKKWTHSKGTWSSELLWEHSWGGKFDRLRDIEVGDVNGDNKEDLVIATHDQGVVAVYHDKDNIIEMDLKADTFVHEIEIGDVDGDGKKEFFATPSARNSAKHSQGGSVVMYKWNGKKYIRSVIAAIDKTHAKEILIADMDANGIDELYVVKEAVKIGNAIITPVQIVRYIFERGEWKSRMIHSIQDTQTRFLLSGDWDGDGVLDMVAASMKTGLWFIKRDAQDNWSSQLIDANSSGFEHSAYGADLDKDGVLELYVAADDQLSLNQYIYKDGVFEKEKLGDIPPNTFTWNIISGSF